MVKVRNLKILSGSLELPLGTEFKLFKGADRVTGKQVFGALLVRQTGRMAVCGDPPRSVALSGDEEFIVTKKVKVAKAKKTETSTEAGLGAPAFA